MSAATTLRKCKLCALEKPLTEYYVSRTARSGYQSRCKRCDNRRNGVGKPLRIADRDEPFEHCTLEDVARALGVSAARAGQIERVALRKLRRVAARRGVTP